MVKDIFVDGVGNISVQAGLSRIELTQLKKLPAEGATPEFDITERLAMSLETVSYTHLTLPTIYSV